MASRNQMRDSTASLKLLSRVYAETRRGYNTHTTCNALHMCRNSALLYKKNPLHTVPYTICAHHYTHTAYGLHCVCLERVTQNTRISRDLLHFGGAEIEMTYNLAHCVLRNTPVPVNKETIKIKSGSWLYFSLAKSHGVIFFLTRCESTAFRLLVAGAEDVRERPLSPSLSASLSRGGERGGKMTRERARETSAQNKEQAD